MEVVINNGALQSLQTERLSLLKRLSQIDEAILALTGSNKEISWTIRAMECITGWNQLIQTTEILDCMFYNDPVLQNPKRKRDYLTSLSVTLNKLCKSGHLIKVPYKGIQGYFYGLPQWVDAEGNVKNEYLEKLFAKIDAKRAG